ncbi:MAG TPA: hypothetical protein VMG82_16255 [Candidatus Sulfotelmatobacter sp.]|nr:hypothetical protein [Candidatus Sulfotelmatobacter sp.]
MTVDEYKACYVGARLVSFNYYAHTHVGYNAVAVMAKHAEDYAAPEERANAKDPEYEESLNLEYRICRACGRKSTRQLDRHLKTLHGWTLEQYREVYLDAPVFTPSSRRRQMNWLRSHPDVAKARNARSAANTKRKLEMFPTLTAQIAEAERIAIDMRGQLAIRQQALADQESAIKRLQLQLAASQPTRVQVRNEYPAVLARMQEIFWHSEQKLFDDRWTEFERAHILCARRAVLDRVWKKNRAKAAARMYLADSFNLTLRTIEDYLEDLT